MAAATLGVAASAALDPRLAWAGTIRQTADQLVLATPAPRKHGAFLPNYTSTTEEEDRRALRSRRSDRGSPAGGSPEQAPRRDPTCIAQSLNTAYIRSECRYEYSTSLRSQHGFDDS